MHQYWVYVMSNGYGNVLYVGVTNDLMRRVAEHKSGEISGFTAQYRCHCLVYVEEYYDIEKAIVREKEIKGWKRWKKERLIKKMNPRRVDLAANWA
jgi:putative endonuclease